MRIALLFVALTFPLLNAAQDAEWHSPHSASRLVGEVATICGHVGSSRYVRSARGTPTYINLGPAFPDHVFTILIWGSDRHRFSYPPESIDGTLCAHGEISLYEGTPQMIVSSPNQLSYQSR